MSQTVLPCIEFSTPCAAPRWAELERKLIARMEQAMEAYIARYTRADGTLKWRDFWPGMDGSDDAFEAFQNFPLFYALGASERTLHLAHFFWDTVAWQWTEYGQLDREFFAYYDWMHHGEGSLFLYYFGLADSNSLKFRTRAERFASMYTGEDGRAPNYDAALRQMRAPINGSRGPRHHHTAEDWVTHRAVLDNYLPPFEDMPGIPFGNVCAWSDDATYETILDFINRRMAKGDVPLNLNATSLVTHAYMYTGLEKYRQWVLDYLDSWRRRTRENGGVIPDNVGLTGKIGEHLDGKWWGGYYGWRWPHGAATVVEPLLVAGCNALLLTGDAHWLDLARSQMDMLYDLRVHDAQGTPLLPHRHYDTGWGDYRKENTKWPVYLWSVTQDASDMARIARLPDQESWGEVPRQLGKGNRMDIHPWYHYIRGGNPAFPEQTLEANLDAVERRVLEIERDVEDVGDKDIHHWQDKNPVVCEALVQLMMGGPTNIYHGGLQYAALRYFAGDRPGLPQGVGALVEKLDADGAVVCFHNMSRQACTFTVQGGVFGEHRILRATELGERDAPARVLDVNGRHMNVSLAPGCGCKLRLDMQRFALRPTYSTPTMVEGDLPRPIVPREKDW